MAREYLLEIKDVHKSFSGVPVLKGVNLNVRPGTVHSLMGENGAGKSTLMKCMFGIYFQEKGEFFLDGKQFNFDDPKHALENGVSMVHQELNQILQMTVSDNIWLGRYQKKGIVIDEKTKFAETKKLFEEIGVDVDPNAKLSDLSVSKRQMIEIAKAISYDAKIIVLDEPTSSLTEKEVDTLYKIIRNLKEKGCGIIYISHKMDEIFEISDEVTVLRDGEYVGTEKIEDLDLDKIVAMMVGRNLENRFPEVTNVPGETYLKIENLTTTYEPRIKDINLEVRKGEILGLYGLVGAGRSELVESLFGIRTLDSGKIYLDGKLLDNSTPLKSRQNKFALLTEERRATGIFPVANIRFNSCSANFHNYLKGVMLNNTKMVSDTDEQIKNMKIKTNGQSSLISELSGGNQQKVIIGKWLLTNPDILLLDEPTRGIDVGAKYEIYQLMIKLASQGKAIIMVSSEMPELMGCTNRIAVMSSGRISGIVDSKETTQEEIFNLAAKYL